MRPDRPKLEAQHEEGQKDQQKDLAHRNQAQSPAHRSGDDAKASHTEAGQGRVRSQDPNFGRGHH